VKSNVKTILPLATFFIITQIWASQKSPSELFREFQQCNQRKQQIGQTFKAMGKLTRKMPRRVHVISNDAELHNHRVRTNIDYQLQETEAGLKFDLHRTQQRQQELLRLIPKEWLEKSQKKNKAFAEKPENFYDYTPKHLQTAESKAKVAYNKECFKKKQRELLEQKRNK